MITCDTVSIKALLVPLTACKIAQSILYRYSVYFSVRPNKWSEFPTKEKYDRRDYDQGENQDYA